MRPDRLYHHLAQLEDGKLIEVADYRRLPGGKVERVYGTAPIEPPGDDAHDSARTTPTARPLAETHRPLPGRACDAQALPLLPLGLRGTDRRPVRSANDNCTMHAGGYTSWTTQMLGSQ